MGGGALRECGEVVAALKDGDEAALGKRLGDLAGPTGECEVIVGGELDIGQRVICVGIETGGEEDHLRFKLADSGEAFALKGIPILVDGGPMGKRAIDGITLTGPGAGFVEFAGMGVKR